MLSFINTKLQVWALRISTAICIAVLLFWAACHLFVPGAIKNVVQAYGEKIGYQVAYQDLSISPLRLRVEVDGLHLADQSQNKLLNLKKTVIMLKWSSLMMGEIGFDEIVLDGPSLALIKPKANMSQWNWQEFVAAVAKNLPPADPAQTKKPVKISVDEFKLTHGSLFVSDAGSKLEEEFKNFSIELFDVANYDKAGEINGVRGQYGLNLGALHFTLPKLNKKITFKHVAVKGGIDNSGPETLSAQVDFEIDDGFIKTHWEVRGDKSVSGRVQVENIALEPFITLIPANKELQAKSGLLQSDMAIEIKGGEVLVSGDLHILELDIREPGHKQVLLSWKAGDINRFSYKNSKISGSSLMIEELLVTQPAALFEIDEKGFSNFRRLFSKTVNSKPAEQSDVLQSDKNSVTERSKDPSFRFDIGTVKLRNGEVAYSDLAIRPNFNVDLRRFNATATGVSNAPGKSALLELDGLVARSGSMHARGQVSFDDPRRNNNFTTTFKNLPLTAFNPPVMTFAGYQIASGRLNLNLQYQAKDGDLKGSNQIVIKQVKLGEEVPDFQGKKLPLGLAIALLEDADDTIDVTINIAGNVDSPEFSAAGLVWQAITNVLTNVATAPFRALGALLGMGANDGVNAVVGEVVYLPPDQDRLEKFGDFLVKRPNATLELVGTYDPALDKEGLARAIADTAISKAAGIAIALNEPVPTPNFAEPKTQSALRSAYAQYVGRIKLGQRLITLPDGAARNEQLYKELIASIPVTDADLKLLAKARAKLASELMAKNNPNLTPRISLGEVKAVTAGKDGVPLEMEVRIK